MTHVEQTCARDRHAHLVAVDALAAALAAVCREAIDVARVRSRPGPRASGGQ